MTFSYLRFSNLLATAFSVSRTLTLEGWMSINTMSTRVLLIYIVIGIALGQVHAAWLDDLFIDASPGMPAANHQTLFRRYRNSTTECLPALKQVSLPSDCSGLTGCASTS